MRAMAPCSHLMRKSRYLFYTLVRYLFYSLVYSVPIHRHRKKGRRGWSWRGIRTKNRCTRRSAPPPIALPFNAYEILKSIAEYVNYIETWLIYLRFFAFEGHTTVG